MKPEKTLIVDNTKLALIIKENYFDKYELILIGDINVLDCKILEEAINLGAIFHPIPKKLLNESHEKIFEYFKKEREERKLKIQKIKNATKKEVELPTPNEQEDLLTHLENNVVKEHIIKIWNKDI